MLTETHVYAFSMAANILLSFFPFLIVMVSISRYVLEWHAAEEAIYLALRDYFPGSLGDFIQRNLKWTVTSRGPFQAISVLLLLFTANGIFEPLEVALNRAWGIQRNRNYFHNQLISFGLILVCGALALISTVFTALNQQLWANLTGTGVWIATLVTTIFLKVAAVPITIVLLFLIYWLLPNAKVDPRRVASAAIVVGLTLEVMKYINLLTWPWLRAKLQMEYGPFHYSASIVLWGFLVSMVVLGGAEWAARVPREPIQAGLQSNGEVDRL